MARRPVPSVATDLAAVTAFLRERGVIPGNASVQMLLSAKKIHRATYSLILWRFRLRRIPEHGKSFIEEIASDALQILPQAMMGYNKAVKLLARGIVENTLRHIYFTDHPIEFARMNRGTKWYISVEELFEYLKIHPIFCETEGRFDAVNRLRTLYDELSAGVHGRTVSDLEMRAALRRISYVEDTGRKDVALVEKCAEAANFCLAMFNRDRMDSFSQEDRRVILQTMAPRARELWLEGA